MKGVVLLLCMCVVITPLVNGYGEPDSTGAPEWYERANHYFANAVRVDPTAYKTIYMSGYSPSPASILGSTYPATAPFYIISELCAAADFHSKDLANTNTFSHSSSDGTQPFTRVKRFYTCSGTLGENIAAGNEDPLATNNQWLCDQVGSACAADGSGSDGHRSGIMNKNYKAVGIALFAKSGTSYTNYWTQDFGGATCVATTNPIYSGTHYPTPYKTPTKIKFVAVFYLATAVRPDSANVIVGGTAYALTKELGTDGRGTYIFEQAIGAAGSGCRSYYFEFKVGSTTYRYPDTGCLTTFKEGGCTTSYTSTCSGGGSTTGSSTTGSATIAPTTAPTRAPTSAPTGVPTTAPTRVPTTAPTAAPSTAPTSQPTIKPTGAPTIQPTGVPTGAPTRQPTGVPTGAPTREPTEKPGEPTREPTGAPTIGPTGAPTSQPTAAPTRTPTTAPTRAPTVAPTTKAPATTKPPTTTKAPTTKATTAPTTKATTAPTKPATGGYNIYTSSLQNGWTTLQNPGVTVNTAASYKSETAVSGVLTTTQNKDWFAFHRTTAVSTAGYTTLRLRIAASVATQLRIYFNGGYLQTPSVTTSYQTIDYALSSLLDLSKGNNIGGSTGYLIIQGSGKAVTVYVNSVQLL